MDILISSFRRTKRRKKRIKMRKESKEKTKHLFREFRKSMREEGVPEGLIEKGVSRAEGYIQGITKMLDGRNPDLVTRAEVEMVPEALKHSERWIERFREIFLLD